MMIPLDNFFFFKEGQEVKEILNMPMLCAKISPQLQALNEFPWNIGKKKQKKQTNKQTKTTKTYGNI